MTKKERYSERQKKALEEIVELFNNQTTNSWHFEGFATKIAPGMYHGWTEVHEVNLIGPMCTMRLEFKHAEPVYVLHKIKQAIKIVMI